MAPIWLRKEEDETVVLIEVDGAWHEIIRELSDGEFSHIWEGLMSASKPDPLTQPATDAVA